MGITTHYVPKIEEFHVGFEYELLDYGGNMKGKEWREDIITLVEDIENAREWLRDGEIRVKYLDKEDIESFGFVWYETFDNTLFFSTQFKGYLIKLTFDTINHVVLISRAKPKFFQTIRNQS